MTLLASAQGGAGVAESLCFWVLAIGALAGAVGVVISKEIIRTAMCLLATLVAMAGLYFLLGGYFLGAVQLIVYAGGVLVLFVFGVMLTARSPQVSFEPKWFEMAAGAGICAVLLATLLHVVLRTDWPGEAGDVPDATVAAIGQQFLGDYLVPFEAASILLLVVMIGAAFLARPIRRDRRRSQRDA
jgi:NADH-quinone oxidoreductase subunit J